MDLRERWIIKQREMQAYLDTLTKKTRNSAIRYVIPGARRGRVIWHILVASSCMPRSTAVRPPC